MFHPFSSSAVDTEVAPKEKRSAARDVTDSCVRVSSQAKAGQSGRIADPDFACARSGLRSRGKGEFSPMTIKGQAYIAGAYEHPTRHAPDKSVAQLHAEVALGALADAGLTRENIDGFFCAGDAPGPGPASMAEYLNTRQICAMSTRPSSAVLPMWRWLHTRPSRSHSASATWR